MSGIKQPGEKKLMFFSGRAYPGAGRGGGRPFGVDTTPTTAA